MKRIYKSAEPAALLAWKVGKNWQGNPPLWNELSAEASESVRITTSTDQRQLCCYCSGSIGIGAFHIEHFRPQKSNAPLRFAWGNLLASCESFKMEAFEGEPVETQLHCGHRKADWFEEGVTQDPQSANVESRFRYPLTGKVAPNKALDKAEYDAVQLTIDKLNLNAPARQMRRRRILTQAVVAAESLSKAEWLSIYLPENAASLPEFWPALKYNYDTQLAAKF